MSRGRVFIVQEVLKRCSRTREMVPVHDFSPALHFGILVPLLTSSKMSLSPQPMIHDLKRKLAGFCDDDYLLAVGDPKAIGIATAIAAHMNRGIVKILSWDRRERQYLCVEYNIHH